tara:strand:+ start:121 stop:426 length:306 start_codon:yes stop_codon:yes gene_type:complete
LEVLQHLVVEVVEQQVQVQLLIFQVYQVQTEDLEVVDQEFVLKELVMQEVLIHLKETMVELQELQVNLLAVVEVVAVPRLQEVMFQAQLLEVMVEQELQIQ